MEATKERCGVLVSRLDQLVKRRECALQRLLALPPVPGLGECDEVLEVVADLLAVELQRVQGRDQGGLSAIEGDRDTFGIRPELLVYELRREFQPRAEPQCVAEVPHDGLEFEARQHDVAGRDHALHLEPLHVGAGALEPGVVGAEAHEVELERVLLGEAVERAALQAAQRPGPELQDVHPELAEELGGGALVGGGLHAGVHRVAGLHPVPGLLLELAELDVHQDLTEAAFGLVQTLREAAGEARVVALVEGGADHAHRQLRPIGCEQRVELIAHDGDGVQGALLAPPGFDGAGLDGDGLEARGGQDVGLAGRNGGLLLVATNQRNKVQNLTD